MIISKKVKLKTVGILIEYYKNLGYDTSHKKEIEINVEELTKGSSCLVDVKCSYCNKVYTIQYSRYIKSKSNGDFIPIKKQGDNISYNI